MAPDYDLTFSPRITTRQGPLLQAEFRQRLQDGSYSIKGYGIYQLDPGAYAGQPGDRNWRGGVDTHGQFALNDKWVWGWDGVFLSDYMFMQDYRLAQYRDPLASFLTLADGSDLAALSDRRRQPQLLRRAGDLLSELLRPAGTGAGDPPGRRLQQRHQQQHFRRRVQLQDELHEPDAQSTAAFDPITTLANTNGLCLNASADPMARLPAQCLLRGMPGTYTRATVEAQWRQILHRPDRPDLDAVCDRAGRRDRCLDLEPAGRLQFPARRRHPGDAGDADRRPRISLSLHQRAALGHHHDRADRTGHPAPERNLCRQASQRGRPEPGVRRLQPVLRSTSSPVTTASKAAAAPMSACRPPRNSIAAARSTCCSASPTSCSA